MNLSFTNGVISSAFDRLLSDNHLANFRQLSKSDFLDMLKAHQYGINFSKNFELIMLEEELKHKKFLESLIDKNHILFNVLYLKFNHLFLSSVLKSYHMGVKYTPILEGLTTYNQNHITEYLFKENTMLIDFDLKIFIDNLVDKTKNLDAQGISDKVMQILHEEILNSLPKKDKSLNKYYHTYTMIQNVLFLVRYKKYNLSFDNLKENILENEIIDKHMLLNFFDKSFNELGEYLSIHFGESIKNVFKHDEHDDFLRNVLNMLELSMTDLLSTFAFDNDTLGLAIYYTIKKREEIIKLKQYYYQVEA